MKRALRLIVVLTAAIALASCKVFTRCSLTEELTRLNFPRSFIGNWVCLVESGSGKDTSKIVEHANRSKSYGLFQINSKEWCGIGRVAGKCSKKCEDFSNEDLSDDASCAKKIYGELGFRGWEAWTRSCHGRTLPIPRC